MSTYFDMGEVSLYIPLMHEFGFRGSIYNDIQVCHTKITLRIS